MKTIIISEKELPLVIIVDNGTRDDYLKFTDILADVYMQYEVTPSELVGKSGDKRTRLARELFIITAIKQNFSIPEVAKFLRCETHIIHNYIRKS